MKQKFSEYQMEYTTRAEAIRAMLEQVDWRNKAIEIARKATDLDKEAEKMEDPDKQVAPLSVRRGCIGFL